MRKGSACELVVGHEHRPALDTARKVAVHAEVPVRRQPGGDNARETEAAPNDEAAPVKRQGEKPKHKLREEAHERAEPDLEPRPE